MEVPDYYHDQPKRSFTLESCWRIESKTRQFPFVVASDLASIGPAPVSDRRHSEDSNEAISVPTPTVTYADLLNGSLSGHFVKPTHLETSLSTSEGDNLDGENNDLTKKASREFLIFHDVEHYLTLKDQYPHCHEIIRCPLNNDFESQFGEKSYRDDLCRGRLIFDFDLEVPLPEMESICNMKSLSNSFNGQQENHPVDPSLFVPPNFKAIIEYLVNLTFKTYYFNVDLSKLMFVWQITRHDHKFSMHLIVKHAYFSEYWVKQTRIFYCLFCRLATLSGVSSIIKAVDLQMARRNATFRILGCSKIDGKVIELESCTRNGQDLLAQGYPLTMYDCLVGIYHVNHLKEEQCISMDNINYLAIEREVDRSRGEGQTDAVKTFQAGIKKQLPSAEEIKPVVNLDDKCIETAVALFDRFNDGTFAIRDQVGAIINLNRLRAAPCPVSGVRHDNENAYLKLREDGRLIFVCRRGCKNGNFYGCDLGVYRRSGIVPPSNASHPSASDKGKEEADGYDEFGDQDDEPIEQQDIGGETEKPVRIVPISRKKLDAVMHAQVHVVGVDIENPGTFVRKNPVKTPKTVYSRKSKTLPKRVTATNSSIYIPEGLRFPKLTAAK